MSNTYNLTSKLAKFTFSAAALVILGLLMVESCLDDKMNKNFGFLGFFFFVSGWIMISLCVSMDEDLNLDSYETHGIYALLVLISSLIPMFPYIFRSLSPNIVKYGSFIYMIFWLLFAVTIGYKGVKVFDGNFDYDRFYLALSGALLILLSSYFLITYRKLRFSTLSHTKVISEIKVFNPGLVIFTIGWFLIVLSILKE